MSISASIGIITANRVDYLRQALDSALAGGEQITKIIVVDDGSTDGTTSYLKTVSDPRLKVISFETNQGRPKARNAVVEALETDVLIWLDDDDALEPDTVEKQLACLAANPTANIIYLNHIACDENLKPIEEAPSKHVEDGRMLMQFVFENIVPNGGTLITKKTFDTIGGYDEQFLRSQDYHFYARAAAADCVFVHNNQPLYRFRRHADNLANPEVIRNQSKYQCLILQEILSSVPIEKVFPVLDWKAEPEGSLAQAMSIVARVFFDHGDDQSALECIEHALQYRDEPRAQLIYGFILRALGEFEASSEAFALAVAELEPDLSGMFVTIGASRGSALHADRAKAEREKAS